MTKPEAIFLDLVRAAIHREVPADPGLTPEEWEALLRLSERHKLLALTVDAAWPLASFQEFLGREAAGAPAETWTDRALRRVNEQVAQENEFLNAILGLQARGLDPISVKGAALRALYPKPLLRPSVDDDLMIAPEEIPAYRAALLELGLYEEHKSQGVSMEPSFRKANTPLYIELHAVFFNPNSAAYQNMDQELEGAMDRAVPLRVQDVTMKTLAPTDHMLFLILHAYKHFLGRGIGIRIMADLCLYAQRWAAEIDFARIRAVCAAHRCETFTAAVFRVGEQYLNLPVPAAFEDLKPEVADLLADSLENGLHGDDINRAHSARIVVGAVEDQNLGRTSPGGLRATVFLPRSEMVKRYPFLDRAPWLLPVTWGLRVGKYLRNKERYAGKNPAAVLRIGKERVNLLKEYKIIDP